MTERGAGLQQEQANQSSETRKVEEQLKAVNGGNPFTKDSVSGRQRSPDFVAAVVLRLVVESGRVENEDWEWI